MRITSRNIRVWNNAHKGCVAITTRSKTKRRCCHPDGPGIEIRDPEGLALCRHPDLFFLNPDVAPDLGTDFKWGRPDLDGLVVDEKGSNEERVRK